MESSKCSLLTGIIQVKSVMKQKKKTYKSTENEEIARQQYTSTTDGWARAVVFCHVRLYYADTSDASPYRNAPAAVGRGSLSHVTHELVKSQARQREKEEVTTIHLYLLTRREITSKVIDEPVWVREGKVRS